MLSRTILAILALLTYPKMFPDPFSILLLLLLRRLTRLDASAQQQLQCRTKWERELRLMGHVSRVASM